MPLADKESAAHLSMHGFACLNHEIIPVSKIFLPAVSSAGFYGRGIFTTIAIYRSEPFQWRKHWFRLTENSKTIGIDLSEITEEKVKNSLNELISRNKVQNGRARITFLDESISGAWQIQNERKVGILITTADFRTLPDNFRLTVSPYPINSKSPLNGVKSCNYLENLLALEEAKSRGFDEAIRLNEKGEVACATMASVFWVQNETIYTPALLSGPLLGTTRQLISENFPVIEKTASLDELFNAEAIFITSSGIGIMQVQSFQEIFYKTSEVLLKIQDFFNEFVR